ncbi:MAG: methyltransferase domain-containing protein [Thermoleophilia bacterium]|nr:methyltransferase domain-containing protein [Thermoleophilia bacterium]
MSADVWSGRADAYRGAADQQAGDDLELLVSWAEGRTALDVATGGGHTAGRLREAGFDVVTLDPAPGMRADVLARAEDIPFADGSFDVITCRIAPHHFEDVGVAVAELARVSRDLVLVEDTLYEDERVEEAERLRDPTHVRSYSEEEWRGLFDAAGLTVEEIRVVEKSRPVDTWLERAGCTGAEAERVKELLGDRVAGGEYVDRKILLRGRKR